MKILFVLENYYPHIGGAESVFKQLAEGLVERGHEVVVVTHRLRGTRKVENVNGVKINRVFSFGSRYWFTFFSLFSVLKFAKWADVIHTTTYNGAPPAWFAAKVFGEPAVITVHEVLGKRWRWLADSNFVFVKFHEIFERVILKLGFDCYAAVSKSTAKQLSSLVDSGKVKVVYNGLDYSFWDSRKVDGNAIKKKLNLEKKFVGLFYGRPGISKGLEVLIKAIPAIVKEVPTFHLIAIVSKDRAYRRRAERLRQLAGNLKVSEHITFLHSVPREELPKFVKAADCVIVPSLSEGFGFAVAEASAMDRIVVASDVDSIPEVVSGKWILFRAGDAMDLARAIVDAYNGRYARGKLKKFKLEDNIENYLSLYSRLA